MPLTDDINNYSDYGELGIAHDKQYAIEQSKSNKSAISPFLAAVSIDRKRKNPVQISGKL
jgi:hypothetical protein